MIEIDAQNRLEALRHALSRCLADLSAAGHGPELVGAAALAQIADLVPTPCLPLLIAVDGDVAAAQRVAGARIGDGYELRLLGRGADGQPLSAASPCHALSLRCDAAGSVVDPHGVIQGAQATLAGSLTGSVDWSRWLRGKADRILELAAMAAQTGLTPEPDVVRAMTRDGGHVLALDRQRWLHWMDVILSAPCASVGLRLLQQCAVLPLMVHEVVAMVDFHLSCPIHHKDIWDHTLQVVDKCPPVPAVRWAALMHDAGKVWTRTVTPRGKVHFFRHEELGASLMRGVAARFTMPAERSEQICYVIANHARANVYSTEWTDSAVRRLIRDMGEHLDLVLAFSRSDFTTKRAWRIREVRELGEELVRRIDDVRAADARVPALPKGFGNLAMARTGRRGGPWLGALQRHIEAAVEAGELAPGLDADAYFRWAELHAATLLAGDVDGSDADKPAAPADAVAMQAGESA